MESNLSGIFSEFDGKKEEIIPLLQRVQDAEGFLSENSMAEIARFLKIPASNVYGVATFYAQFRFKPNGRTHVMLCRGTACHVKGAPKILEDIENKLGIKEGETSADREYSIVSVACIGACSLAPCAVINNKVEADLTSKKVEKIFAKTGKK